MCSFRMVWRLWSCPGGLAHVIMVWLFNNTGKSVFGAAVFYAMLNLGWFLFPDEYFDPPVAGLIMAWVAAFAVIVWGPKTLARNRFT